MPRTSVRRAVYPQDSSKRAKGKAQQVHSDPGSENETLWRKVAYRPRTVNNILTEEESDESFDEHGAQEGDSESVSDGPESEDMDEESIEHTLKSHQQRTCTANGALPNIASVAARLRRPSAKIVAQRVDEEELQEQQRQKEVRHRARQRAKQLAANDFEDFPMSDVDDGNARHFAPVAGPGTIEVVDTEPMLRSKSLQRRKVIIAGKWPSASRQEDRHQEPPKKRRVRVVRPVATTGSLATPVNATLTNTLDTMTQGDVPAMLANIVHAGFSGTNMDVATTSTAPATLVGGPAIPVPIAVSTGGSRRRGRQGDYNGDAKSIIQLTVALFKMHIYTVHPCPPNAYKVIEDLWNSAAKELNIVMAANPEVIHTISDGTSSIRGHFKEHVVKHTDKYYGLSNIDNMNERTFLAKKALWSQSYIYKAIFCFLTIIIPADTRFQEYSTLKSAPVPQDDEACSAHQDRLKQLYSPADRGAPYLSPLIARIIATRFYGEGKASIAKAFPEYFNESEGLPLALIAYVATMIEFTLTAYAEMDDEKAHMCKVGSLDRSWITTHWEKHMSFITTFKNTRHGDVRSAIRRAVLKQTKEYLQIPGSEDETSGSDNFEDNAAIETGADALAAL